MKFSDNTPVVTRNQFDHDMYMLRKEFDRLLLLNAVVASYVSTTCLQTKERIKALKYKD